MADVMWDSPQVSVAVSPDIHPDYFNQDLANIGMMTTHVVTFRREWFALDNDLRIAVYVCNKCPSFHAAASECRKIGARALQHGCTDSRNPIYREGRKK